VSSLLEFFEKEIRIYHGYILQSWDYFSSHLHYQHASSTSGDTQDAILIKLSAVTLELFTHTVFQLSTKNSILRLIPSGGKKNEVRVLNWNCMEDKEEQCTPLLHLPPLSDTVMQVDLFTFTFFFAWTLCSHCFNFFTIGTCHSELIMARTSKNSTSKVPCPSRR
jgi:hypothetical protein